MTSGISISWSPELEAQYQEWEKAHHVLEVQRHKMGRPPKSLDPAILHGPGSLREKGRSLGVSPMTVMRRLRKEG